MADLLFVPAILLIVLVVYALASWVLVAGDREQDIVDEEIHFTTSYEEPTLNTRGKDR